MGTAFTIFSVLLVVILSGSTNAAAPTCPISSGALGESFLVVGNAWTLVRGDVNG
jgi:hypothetical protein